MRAVDTNVLVRCLTRDDEAQAASADAFIADGAWVSHVVLAETTWVLRSVYDVGPAAIADAVEALLEHDRLVMQDSDAVWDAVRAFRKRPALGFSDCLVVAVARKAGHLPVGTFDRALARLDGVQKLPS